MSDTYVIFKLYAAEWRRCVSPFHFYFNNLERANSPRSRILEYITRFGERGSA